jgi:hypothetical protein
MTRYASPYELKKRLKHFGIDLEGLQVRQGNNGSQFVVVPLNEFAYEDNGSAITTTSVNPDEVDLVNRMNEIARIVQATNAAVGKSHLLT